MNNDISNRIANCFNNIHVKLGQELTAEEVKTIFKLHDLIMSADNLESIEQQKSGIPNVILEASKESFK